MLDFSSMLMVKSPIVEKIHPQSDMFAMGLQNKGTGDSKLHQSPGLKVTHKGPQVILGHDLKEFPKEHYWLDQYIVQMIRQPSFTNPTS